MKRWLLRGLGLMLGVVGVATIALAIYVARTWNRQWDAPLPEIHASTDPEVIRRGEYLVFGPAHCSECHVASMAEFESSLGSKQLVALRGGMRFAAPPLGVMYSRNLTPDPETGIGRYSDAQLARMLRYSVRPDGRASAQLLMPFGEMSDADIVAIISFLRSQPPVRNVVPEAEFTLIGKVVKSVAPVFKPRHPAGPSAESPAEAPTRERGEYLARSVANCVGCHTKRDPLSFAAVGPEFAGGWEMEPASRTGADPATWFRTPNLTPAPGGALAKFPDRETFVARFQRGGVHYAGSPMPWEAFGKMSEADLGALYEYLRALPAQPGPTGEPTFVKGGEARPSTAAAN